MITEEHLRHWMNQIQYQLNSIKKEVASKKVVMKGINVGVTGENYVSFEYLREKADAIQKILWRIEEDIRIDKAGIIKIIEDENKKEYD